MDTNNVEWSKIQTSGTPVPTREKPALNLSPSDTLFAAAMLVCGFLYWNFIMYADMPGAGATLFAFIIFALTSIYLAKAGFRQNAKSLTCLTLAALSAIQFSLFDNAFIAFLNFIFLSALFVYWICLTTGRRIDSTLSHYFLSDMIQQGIIVPFLNFGTGAIALAQIPRKQNAKSFLLAITGVIIVLPILLAVLSLLISADSAFEAVVNRAFQSMQISAIVPYMWQFVFGLPVALYLFGLIYGNMRARYTDILTKESVDQSALLARIAPKVMVYSALAAFNFLYLIFFAAQTIYIFSALNGILPETFTYAEYARRGFFELCAVAGINLAIVLVSHLIIRRELHESPRVLRIATVILSFFTSLLIVTALSKMLMYIGAYGLTQLRIYTSWFMILMFFIFAVISVRQLKAFNSSRVIIIGFVTLFLLLAYGNIDGIIARYNIQQYESGALSELDVKALNRLSDGAIAPMYEAFKNLDVSNEKNSNLKHELFGIIKREPTYGTHDFRSFNYQRFQARKIQSEIRWEMN